MDNKPTTAKGQLSELADFIFEMQRVAELDGHEFSRDDKEAISKAWHLLDDPSERAATEAEDARKNEIERQQELEELNRYYYSTRGIK
jgi:hypothetical protein